MGVGSLNFLVGKQAFSAKIVGDARESFGVLAELTQEKDAKASGNFQRRNMRGVVSSWVSSYEGGL